MLADLSLPAADFNATTVLVSANTEKGREFLAQFCGIAGVVGVEIWKSQLQRLADMAAEAGVTIL